MVEKGVMCFDYAKVNDKCYFSLHGHNALCSIKYGENRPRIIGVYEKEKNNTTIPFGKVCTVDECCIFLPYYANEVVIYHIDGEKVSSVPIFGDKVEWNSDRIKIWNAIQYGEKILLFGFHYPLIWVFDIKTMSIERQMDSIIDMLPAEYGELSSDKWFFGDGVVKCDGKVYIPCGLSPGVWEIDPEGKKINYIDTGIDVSGFYSIADAGDYFILTCAQVEKKIFLWNKKTGLSREIAIPCEDVWHPPVVYGNRAFLFPVFTGAHILQVNLDTFHAEIFVALEQIIESDMEDSLIIALKAYGSKISFISTYDKYWYSYDMETAAYTKQYFEVDDAAYIDKCEQEKLNERFDFAMKNQGFIDEREMSLMDFLERI